MRQINSKFLWVLCGLLISTGFFISCSSAPKRPNSPFLGNITKFEISPKDENTLLYKNPALKAVDFDNFIFDPLLIFQSEHTKYGQLSDGEKDDLSKLFQNQIKEVFKTTINIVDQKGPDVLRVRTAVRGLQRGEYKMGDGMPIKINEDSKLSAATFELEVIHSITGERAVGIVRNVKAAELRGHEREEVVSTVGASFLEWIKVLKIAFAENKSLSTIPK